MESKFVISRFHLLVLISAGVVALLAQRWTVGILVLVMAFGVGIFVIAMERRDSSPHNRQE